VLEPWGLALESCAPPPLPCFLQGKVLWGGDLLAGPQGGVSIPASTLDPRSCPLSWVT
jgi:hypothetical protein